MLQEWQPVGLVVEMHRERLTARQYPYALRDKRDRDPTGEVRATGMPRLPNLEAQAGSGFKSH